MKESKAVLRSFLPVALSLVLILPAVADMRMWVAVGDLKRRTCPSTDCGIVGKFFFQESLFVYETENGWSRVSASKPAGCYAGKAAYVETGRSDCSRENGIIQGEFSEWVQSKFLADEKPDAPLDMHG